MKTAASWRERGTPAALWAIASVMRWFSIQQPIGDEAATFLNFIEPGFWVAVSNDAGPSNHLAFSALAAIAYAPFKSIVPVYILVCALAGLGAPGIFLLCRRINLPVVTALCAVILYILHPAAVDLGSQLRGYTIVLGIAPWIWLLALELRSDKAGLMQRVAFVGASVLCISAHLVSGGIAFISTLIVFAADKARFRQHALCVAATALGVVVLHLGVLDSFLNYASTSSHESKYLPVQWQLTFGFFLGSNAGWSFVVGALLTIAGSAAFVRNRRSFVGLALATPTVCALLAFAILERFSFARFFCTGIVPLLILWSASACLAPKRFRVFASVAVLGLCLAMFGNSIKQEFNRFNTGAELAREVRQSGMPVAVAGRFYPLIRFYIPEATVISHKAPIPASGLVIFDTRDRKWKAAKRCL
ncbi:MAG: hypothetical protein AAFY11_07345, partial [Cyanobacteria bacterium J06641_5]